MCKSISFFTFTWRTVFVIINFYIFFHFKANDAAVLSEREPTQVSIFPSELQVRNHIVFKTYASFMLSPAISKN